MNQQDLVEITCNQPAYNNLTDNQKQQFVDQLEKAINAVKSNSQWSHLGIEAKFNPQVAQAGTGQQQHAHAGGGR
jgi:hypothetical protein